jgi:Glycosyl transferase family 2
VRELRLLAERSREGSDLCWALVRRARELTGTDAVENQISELQAALGGLSDEHSKSAELRTETDLLRSQVATLGNEIRNGEAENAARYDKLARASAATLESIQLELQAVVAEHHKQLRELRGSTSLREKIQTFTEWVASTPLHRLPRVTVILATSDERPHLFRQALDSILDQSYQNFQLLVVAPPDTKLCSTDPRVVILSENESLGKARNIGLREATGEYVVYADDDNTMGPHWLRAVVWALNKHSDVDVVYGARLHESISPDSSGQPAFWHFEEMWNPETLQQFNPIDTQVLGHRAGIPEANWSEELAACLDWDLAIRITANGRVMPLPIRACTYTTRAHGRITDQADSSEARQIVIRRARSARTLRVLSFSHSHPRLSERYIEGEIDGFAPPGFVVAAGSTAPGQAGVSCLVLHLGGFQDAVTRHKPDLVFFHYSDVARRHQQDCEMLDLPYAVRVHSYDEMSANPSEFAHDPRCLGVWAYPQAIDRWGQTAKDLEKIGFLHALPALFRGLENVPHPPGSRSGVLYTSAALPKRPWSDLEEFLARLSTLERRVILGTCDGYEALVQPLGARLREVDPRIDVRIDVQNDEVLRLLTVTSSLLYLPSQTHVVGNPISVVEAWLCGAIPVMFDSRDSRDFAGEHARYFTSVAHAADIVREIEVGGEELTKERLLNREYAVRTHAHPSVRDTLSREMRAAFSVWEQQR